MSGNWLSKAIELLPAIAGSLAEPTVGQYGIVCQENIGIFKVKDM